MPRGACAKAEEMANRTIGKVGIVRPSISENSISETEYSARQSGRVKRGGGPWHVQDPPRSGTPLADFRLAVYLLCSDRHRAQSHWRRVCRSLRQNRNVDLNWVRGTAAGAATRSAGAARATRTARSAGATGTTAAAGAASAGRGCSWRRCAPTAGDKSGGKDDRHSHHQEAAEENGCAELLATAEGKDREHHAKRREGHCPSGRDSES